MFPSLQQTYSGGAEVTTPLQTYRRWIEITETLAALKEEELALRLALVEAYFPNADPEGTATLELQDGWELQLTMRMNRTVANGKGEADAVMRQLPPEVAEKVFAWKPSLQLRGYRKLAPDHKALVDSVVTSTPGTPALKLVAPKEA